jgi:hypothetical protein
MLSRRRRILGDDHPDTLTWTSQLAMVLWYLGDFQQAWQLQNDVFTRFRRVLGEDHPATLGSAGLLGLALLSLGDYQQLWKLQSDTFPRSRRALGEDHNITLFSAFLLGLALWGLVNGHAVVVSVRSARPSLWYCLIAQCL